MLQRPLALRRRVWNLGKTLSLPFHHGSVAEWFECTFCSLLFTPTADTQNQWNPGCISVILTVFSGLLRDSSTFVIESFVVAAVQFYLPSELHFCIPAWKTSAQNHFWGTKFLIWIRLARSLRGRFYCIKDAFRALWSIILVQWTLEQRDEKQLKQPLDCETSNIEATFKKIWH